MLAMVTEENMHSEINAGIPVGKEVLSPYSMDDDKLYSSVEDAVERIKTKQSL